MKLADLDVDKALPILAQLPKLKDKDVTLPLSSSLTSLSPPALSKVKELTLVGAGVKRPPAIPSSLGLLAKLKDLRIEFAEDVDAPHDGADIAALRLLYASSFTHDQMRAASAKQAHVKYLQAFAAVLQSREIRVRGRCLRHFAFGPEQRIGMVDGRE